MSRTWQTKKTRKGWGIISSTNQHLWSGGPWGGLCLGCTKCPFHEPGCVFLMIGHVGCVASIKLLTYENCRLNPIHSMLFSIYFLYCSLYIQQYNNHNISLIISTTPGTWFGAIRLTQLGYLYLKHLWKTHTHIWWEKPFPKMAWTRLDTNTGWK